jgi:hypothetical protein
VNSNLTLFGWYLNYGHMGISKLHHGLFVLLLVQSIYLNTDLYHSTVKKTTRANYWPKNTVVFQTNHRNYIRKQFLKNLDISFRMMLKFIEETFHEF